LGNGRAFGKLDLTKPLGLRRFERFFGIASREGSEAWKSKYKSVQNLLDHLSRFGKSESSKEVYLNQLRRLCEWLKLDPDQLVDLPKHKVEVSVQKFVDQAAGLNRSRAYINSMIKRFRTFFRVNDRSPKLHAYSIPPRYRKRPEYIPTISEVRAMATAAESLRNRTLILVAWSSGVRVSTLCALNYGDIANDLNAEPLAYLGACKTVQHALEVRRANILSQQGDRISYGVHLPIMLPQMAREDGHCQRKTVFPLQKQGRCRVSAI